MPVTPGTIKLVVGLGNPGAEYAHTRHNAGFATVDVLAGRLGVAAWKDQASALVAVAQRDGRELVLAKPQSFMNRSGGPVSALAELYDVAPEEILVIHDDLDIPAGDVRVKFAGGHGGHNGLRSIIDCLDSRDFSRIRFGQGRPPEGMDAATFVLLELKDEAADDFAKTAKRAADAVELCLDEGVITARNQLNARPHKSSTANEPQVEDPASPEEAK